MKIYFHGTTSKKKANSILKNGFKEGTWFANHLEDALEFGGKHIFFVVVTWLGKRTYDWQVCSRNRIRPENIVRYEIHNVKVIKEDKKLMNKIFKANQ